MRSSSGGNVVMETGDGLGLFVDHIVQDFTQIGPGKRRAAREQKVDDGAETEEVAAVIDGLAEGLFGAHVPGGSEDMPVLGLLLGRRRSQTVGGFLQHPLGQAEVQDLDLAALVQADILGLDVTMDDPAGVGGIERVGDLNGDRHDAGNLQRSLLHEVTQRLAFHELHGDERQSVFGLADVVHDADVRMIERRSGFGLGQEPLPAVRIVRQIRRQELDRRLPVETCVFRQEHFPHPACAEPGGDAIVANRLADHQICVLWFSRDAQGDFAWRLSSPVSSQSEKGVNDARSLIVLAGDVEEPHPGRDPTRRAGLGSAGPRTSIMRRAARDASRRALPARSGRRRGAA